MCGGKKHRVIDPSFLMGFRDKAAMLSGSRGHFLEPSRHARPAPAHPAITGFILRPEPVANQAGEVCSPSCASRSKIA
jgi:hypothetical protein